MRCAAAALAVRHALAADLKVGLSVSLSARTPRSASLRQGHAGGAGLQAEINGRKVQLIVLDDGSDPTTAGRNARKLVEEEKVDVLMGTSGVPAAIAMAQVGRETQDADDRPDADRRCRRPRADWIVTVAQPTQLMIDAVVERMKRNGVKTVGYIGFTDAWGDLVYDALMKAAEPAGIKVVSQRALCARRPVGHRPGAEDRRAAARRGDDRRRRHAGRAAVPGAGRARLQGRRVRPARADQPRLRARRRRVRPTAR